MNSYEFLYSLDAAEYAALQAEINQPWPVDSDVNLLDNDSTD